VRRFFCVCLSYFPEKVGMTINVVDSFYFMTFNGNMILAQRDLDEIEKVGKIRV
jgi:hypothetical protein